MPDFAGHFEDDLSRRAGVVGDQPEFAGGLGPGGQTVRLKEDGNHDVRIEIGNHKQIYFGFRIVSTNKPIYKLCVGTNCKDKRQIPLPLSFKIDGFNTWDGGFEFYGKYEDGVMDGDADAIRAWFEAAAKEKPLA